MYKFRKCYACDSTLLQQDRKKLTKQTDSEKIGLLLFKQKSGMWSMTKKELATLKQYFL